MVLDKLSSLNKSRASLRTETEVTVKTHKKQGVFYQPVYLIKVPKYNNKKEQNFKVTVRVFQECLDMGQV